MNAHISRFSRYKRYDMQSKHRKHENLHNNAQSKWAPLGEKCLDEQNSPVSILRRRKKTWLRWRTAGLSWQTPQAKVTTFAGLHGQRRWRPVRASAMHRASFELWIINRRCEKQSRIPSERVTRPIITERVELKQGVFFVCFRIRPDQVSRWEE